MTILHEEAISRMLLLRSTKKAAASNASIKLEKLEQLED
eukprot:08196.XXX_379968_380084_1 [CDS] Oithona nana genome sequencing.